MKKFIGLSALLIVCSSFLALTQTWQTIRAYQVNPHNWYLDGVYNNSSGAFNMAFASSSSPTIQFRSGVDDSGIDWQNDCVAYYDRIERRQHGSSTWTTVASNSYYPGEFIVNVTNLPTGVFYYRRAFSSSFGTPCVLYTFTSNIITVISGGVFNANVTNSIGSSQTICYNSFPTTLLGNSISHDYSNLTGSYLWKESTSSSGPYIDCPGVNNGINYSPPRQTLKKYFRRDFLLSYGSTVYGSNSSNVVYINTLEQFNPGVIGENQTICIGSQPQTMFFSTSPSNVIGTINYQWQTFNGSTWSNISGATNPNYRPDELSSTTQYRANVSNTCGSGTTNVLTITAVPLVPGSITGNQAGCNGFTPSQITSSSPASGGAGTLNYQWEKNEGSGWSNVVGAISLNYTPPTLFSTTSFRRKVSDSCTTEYSNIVTITVYGVVGGGQIGSDETICNNSTPSKIISLSNGSGGHPDGYDYQWERSNDGIEWFNINLATNSEYQPGILTETRHYKRKLFNACGDSYSNVVVKTVAPSLNPGVLTGGTTICPGGVAPNLYFSSPPSGGFGTYLYQWEKSIDGSTWDIIDDQIFPDYQPDNVSVTSYFRVRVTNNCGFAYTNVVTITVSNPLTPGVISSSQVICYNSQPSVLEFSSSPSGGHGVISYQWYSSFDNQDWLPITGASLNYFQPQALTQSRYYKALVSNSCGALFTNTVFIEVYSILQPGSIGSNQEICYNSPASALTTLTPTSGGSGSYSWQWEISLNNQDWVDFLGGLDEGLDPGFLNQTSFFRRKESDALCGTVFSNIVSVYVASPLSSGSIGSSQTICYNTQPTPLQTLTPSTGGLGSFSFQWQSLVGVNWENISNATNEVFNTGPLQNTSNFRRIDSNSCGSVTTNSVAINVLLDFNPGVIGHDQVIFHGNTPSLISSLQSPSGGDGNYSFQWQSKINDGEWGNISSGLYETFQPDPLFVTTLYKRLSTSQLCGTKSTNTVTITVTEDLIPGSIGHNQTICYNSSPDQLVSVQLPSGGNGSYSYVWEFSLNGTAWSEIFGSDGANFQPGTLTSNTYFRRKVSSGPLTRFSNVILISVRELVPVPSTNVQQYYCKGSSPVISILNPYATYRWFNSQMGHIQDGNSLVINNLQASSRYFVRRITTFGCESELAIVDVNIDPIQANFTFSPSNVSVGGKVDFFCNSTNASSWSWNLGFGDIQNVQNPSVYYNVPGLFTVSLTVSSNLGCSDSKALENAINVSSTTSVVPNPISSFSLFPNPTSGNLFILFDGKPFVGPVKLFDSMGRVVFSTNKLYDHIYLPKPGIFLVQVYHEGLVFNFKVIRL